MAFVRDQLDDEEFRRWRDEAGQALDAARVQAQADIHNWACFSAEQAAQLAVKGALHGMSRGPWGHDLVRMAEMLVQAGIDISEEMMNRFRRLGRHYIAARYPNAHASGAAAAHYGQGDATEAIQDAEMILAFVDVIWESLSA